MAVTASSYLDNDGVGYIKLLNDSGWGTSSWSGTFFFTNHYQGWATPYPYSASGIGVLSDSNKVLTISILRPPKRLKLTVGSFEKFIYFLDGGIDAKRELVWAGRSRMFGSSRKQDMFILFNGYPEELVSNSAPVAKILGGGVVIGYALGQRFVNIRNNKPTSSGTRYEFTLGGVIFYRVVWKTVPGSGTYSFLFDNELFSVTWDGSSFTGPSSAQYSVDDWAVKSRDSGTYNNQLRVVSYL